MNKINYDALMLRALEGAAEKRVLLQACCAPCASHCLSELAGKTRVTVYFYNPNLSDREEYEKRRAAMRPFNPSLLAKYEYEETELDIGDSECVNGVCPVR